MTAPATTRRKQAPADHGPAILTCAGVEVGYDQVQVLFGIDLEVREGEVVALLGTNGAGKSTLLRAISGLSKPSGGSITFAGQDITGIEPNAAAALGIVQVPGGKAVFPSLSVAEHLRAAGWLFRKDRRYLAQATGEALDTFPRLRERLSQQAGNLSGGEQQMLALSMAFIARPRLLMIDELSLGLAPVIVEQLLGIVRRIRDSGTAIVLVEQSVNVALTVAERAYFLEKGEVRFEGATADLLERDDILRSVFLHCAAAGTGGAPRRPAAPATPGVTARPRAGEAALEHPGSEPELEVSGLSVRFGGIQAVDAVSFPVGRGSVVGLIGPNGAGKTTIFDLVSGYLAPDSGRITLGRADVTRWAPDRRARSGLGRSFQDARLFPSLTVAENLALSFERHLPVRDHVASTLGLPYARTVEDDVAWSVADLVELMSLGDHRNKFVSELSTGTRRVVDIAMCIAHDPRVLLLDEPSSGIAQREVESLGPLLKRLQQETGCALLVIEHDMPMITSIADVVIALEAGCEIARGTPEEVVRHPRVIASYLGTDEAAITRSGSAAPRARRSRRKGPS